MADYTVSVTYQTPTPDITDNVITEEPALATLNVKIPDGTVVKDDVLRFFVTTTGITGYTNLSWQYTVAEGDDFTTNGKDFTLSGAIMLAITGTTPTFSGKVYKGGDWGFKAA